MESGHNRDKLEHIAPLTNVVEASWTTTLDNDAKPGSMECVAEDVRSRQATLNKRTDNPLRIDACVNAELPRSRASCTGEVRAL